MTLTNRCFRLLLIAILPMTLYACAGNEEQDDRTETTRDDVQKREVENIKLTTTFAHGQSLVGVRKEPPVSNAICQKDTAAIGSPSIGKRMIFTGTPFGKRRIACLKNFRRSSPETVVFEGLRSAWVGKPSVSRRILSGRGLS